MKVAVRITGTIALLATGSAIGNPCSPVLLGSVAENASARQVQVVDGYAYMTNATFGLQIIDVSAPSDPVVAGEWSLPGAAVLGLAVQDGVAFLADMSAGVRILDVTDPAGPTLLRTFQTRGTTTRLDVSGDLLFARVYQHGNWMNTGVEIIDVSDPENPLSLGVFATGLDVISDVLVEGQTAYVLSTDLGLYIFDVSDPRNPQQLGSHPLGGYPKPVPDGYRPALANGVDVADGTVYVTTSADGMWVLDVTDPANPVAISQPQPSQANLWSVEVADGLAMVAAADGFYVIDVAEPASAYLRGHLAVPFEPMFDVTFADGLAYVAARANGLLVIDPTPEMPADLNGDGILNFFDTSEFMSLFVAQDPAADIAEPFGVLNYFDVAQYVQMYAAGCPSGNAL